MSMSKSTAMNERIDKALFARAQSRGTWSTVSNQGDGLVTADGSRKCAVVPIPQLPAGATCDSVVRKLSY